jgi:cytochrome c553
VAPVAALLVAWTGVYSIAANHGHPAWLNWFLELGMRRSVEANAKKIPAPPLADPGFVQLGAAHFQGGCGPCHAAPGEEVNPIFEGMLPSPPRLETEAVRWEDHELHWIVYHGLQYAGMPAWSGTGRTDEVWALVAFLRRITDLSPDAYQRLARGNAPVGEQSLGSLLSSGVETMARTACDRCHDTRSAPPIAGLVPNLGRQSEEYLVRALTEYRTNVRQSGFMEPIAAQLDNDDIAALARHYASLDSPRSTGALSELVQAGGQLAAEGDREKRIPACVSCHVAGRASYPRLAGQSAVYLEAQLRLFRNGGRAGSKQAILMSDIAKRLGDAQIGELAAYFASLPRGSAPDSAGGPP